MYTLDSIKNWLFIDIETVSEAKDLLELYDKNPTKAKLWRKRCEYLRRRYIECEKMTDEELYVSKAALHPEFAKVVCVCLGIYLGDGKAQVVGYADDDEKVVLEKTFTLIEKFKKSIMAKSSASTPQISGHNIKRFDIPVLCKRGLINKLELPDLLKVHNKKPWEMPFIDTAEVWSFGTWQESFTSLDLIANVLGLESSKGDMQGDQVQNEYWNNLNLAGIKKYCQDDVAVTMNVVLEWSNLPVVSLDTIVRV